MIALKAIDLSWYQTLDYFYNLNFNELLMLLFLSILISTVLHYFLNKKDLKVSVDNQIEVIETKKYSFITKTVVVFFILILSYIPVFKLLNTGYFL
jgi:hypothetical protein